MTKTGPMDDRIDQLWSTARARDLDHLGIVCDAYEEEGNELAAGLRWLWRAGAVPNLQPEHDPINEWWGFHWMPEKSGRVAGAARIPTAVWEDLVGGPFGRTENASFETLRSAYEAAARSLIRSSIVG